MMQPADAAIRGCVIVVLALAVMTILGWLMR